MRHLCVTYLFVCGFVFIVRAQAPGSIHASSFHQSTFSISARDTLIRLPNQFIISGTEAILLDSVLLEGGRDYIFDVRYGTLTIKGNSITSLFPDSTARHILVVRYQSFPFSFKPSYQHREPVMRVDTATGQQIKVAKPAAKFSVDDLFGSNLQKSGSIVRGFTVGSNRDLSLNSGFRMQMSGRIADDVDVVAALTDENSPIQPEGTTQTLQEIDKVFVELRSTNMSATLGDFDFNVSGTEFGGINRKLQGAKGVAAYRTEELNGDLVLAGAATRGKFTTNQFQGLDGVQGPYRLTGRNNERTIIVIAGTERVYIDGEQMTRGEINDYIIDYANGEITFTTKRLVTAASRINVDFEYSDRQFNRSLLAVKSGTNFLNNRISFNAAFFRESDDENSPIDVALSDQDTDTLRAAGDDRFKAVRSGVDIVGSGKGQYVSKDTILNVSGSPDTIRIYSYAPEDTANAVYTITFTYVGPGNGDYNKVSIGHYQFTGIKQGSYAPVRFLPLPQSHSLMDFDLGTRIFDNLKLVGEYAFSNFDANKFSDRGDEDNAGSAVKFGMQFSPNDVRIGQTTIGSFDVSLKERFVGKRFVPIDRTNDIEFNRKWNIVDSSNLDEEIREGSLTYLPIKPLAICGGIGWIKRGDSFSTNRYTAATHLAGDSLPKVDYDLEVIRSTNHLSDLSGSWFRHRGNASYTAGIFTPAFRYEGEVLRNQGLAVDTLRQGSFRFNEVAPRLSIENISSMSFNFEYGLRWDDSLFSGKLERASKTFTQRYGWQLQEWNALSSTFDLTVRNKKFTEAFHLRNNSDIETILLRSQTRFNPLNHGVESDWFYEVATERSAKLERVFQHVQKGTGNYIYLGDMNHNNIVDDQDFQLTRFDGDFIVVTVPTDNLIPVIDVKASTRFRVTFSKIFTSQNSFEKTLSALSSETYFRVEEKSSEPDTREIYLLHFSSFLNDQTTLAGSNLISQDVFIQENSPEFSARFRFLQRRGLTQFALQHERTYNREQSVRIRWQLVKEISNQVEFTHKNDNLLATQISNRSRFIISNSLSFDWSYRPEQSVELGFKFGVGQATNFDTTMADLNDQSLRLVYSFEEKGQTRVELSREEVNLDRGGIFLPFELTNGKVAGKTWLWRFGFDYRITQYIQASVSYDGRSEGGGSPIHTARAEVRAFF